MQEIKLNRKFAVPVLGVGGLLKNTICRIEGDRAIISPNHGDLTTPEAMLAFKHSLKELAQGVRLVVCDLHPDFPSTRMGLELGQPSFAVQHHHAHIAAVKAEKGIDEAVLGLALDGFGLGLDGKAWGGELLWVKGEDFTRMGHLFCILQPGGDIAAREPWRMAASLLYSLERTGEVASRFAAQPAAAKLGEIMEKRLNCPLTTSCGRLFDGVSGLLGLVEVAQYEAQAPVELERAVRELHVMPNGWRLSWEGVLDFSPLLGVLADCKDKAQGAGLFHGTLIAGFKEWLSWGRERSGASLMVGAGGCFFNKYLKEGLKEELILPALSPGDASLSLGQAWIGALRANA